jgi:hypothetical protein
MKKIVILLTVLFLFSIAGISQKPTHIVKIGSSIVPDTTLVRVGARGSKYFFKLSAKTGKIYRCYIREKK